MGLEKGEEESGIPPLLPVVAVQNGRLPFNDDGLFCSLCHSTPKNQGSKMGKTTVHVSKDSSSSFYVNATLFIFFPYQLLITKH